MAEGAKMDLPAHERTYDRFIGMATKAAVASFIIPYVGNH